MEDTYWCVTCRREWPLILWQKHEWQCPSGLQTELQLHPHTGWSHVAASLKFGRPHERSAPVGLRAVLSSVAIEKGNHVGIG
jgi:hypothetical protein